MQGFIIERRVAWSHNDWKPILISLDPVRAAKIVASFGEDEDGSPRARAVRLPVD
jgi:hypothetical protein